MDDTLVAGPAGLKGPEYPKAGLIGFSPGPLPLYAGALGFALPWFYLGMLVGAAMTQAAPKPDTGS